MKLAREETRIMVTGRNFYRKNNLKFKGRNRNRNPGKKKIGTRNQNRNLGPRQNGTVQQHWFIPRQPSVRKHIARAHFSAQRSSPLFMGSAQGNVFL
jgi:hypothetical protein